MKVSSRSYVQIQAMGVLALLALFVAISPSASAKPRADKPDAQPVTVIAHLALPGASVSQLVLQERGDKQYLFIEEASKAGFSIVDVTRPNQPNMIKRASWPNEASTGRLQMVNGGLALAAGPDRESVAAERAPSTETVKVLDLSDPGNPKTVLSFSGVTSTFADDARNLVYITNSEGLWILRNNQALAAAAAQHVCSSDDVYDEVASCK